MRRFFNFSAYLFSIAWIFISCNKDLESTIPTGFAESSHIPTEICNQKIIESLHIKNEQGEEILSIDFIPFIQKNTLAKGKVAALKISVRDEDTKKHHRYRCDFYHKRFKESILAYHFYDPEMRPYKLAKFAGKLKDNQFIARYNKECTDYTIDEHCTFNETKLLTSISSLKTKNGKLNSKMSFDIVYDNQHTIASINHQIDLLSTKLQARTSPTTETHNSPTQTINPEYLQFIVRLTCQTNGALYKHNPQLSMLPMILFDKLPSDGQKTFDIEQKTENTEAFYKFHLNTKVESHKDRFPTHILSQLHLDYSAYKSVILDPEDKSAPILEASLKPIDPNNVCCCQSKACQNVIYELNCYPPKIFNYINNCFANGNIVYVKEKSLDPTLYYVCKSSPTSKPVQTTCPVAVCRDCNSGIINKDEKEIPKTGLIATYSCFIQYMD